MRALNRKTLLVILAAIVAVVAAWNWRVADPKILQSLRDITFDNYQRIKPREPLGQPIRIVTIDEASIQAFGQWPWPRTRVAQIVDRLAQLGAATIAFDVVFSEPDRTGPAGLIAQLRESDWPGREAIEASIATLPDNDAVLANSVAQTPVVLGFFNAFDSLQGLPEIKAGFVQLGDDPKPLLTVMKSSVMSIRPLQDAAAGNGSLSLGEQIDDVVRRVPMFLTDSQNIYPAFALETLRVAFGETTYALKTTTASTENVGGQLAMVDFKVGQFVVPVDETGRFLIHYSRNDPALYVSSKDILELPPQELEQLIRDHIVFIGATATGLRDIRVTTLGENVPGVYMHAQIADQILSQSFLERPDWAQGAEIAAMLVISLLIIAILPFAGPLVSAAFGALSSVAVLAGSWFAFDQYGILLDPLFPMLTGTAIFLTTTILLFAFTEREKRFVRGAFQRYLAPDLLLKLERNPDSLKLGGEIRQMTLMFMDIRGFTPISEKLSPQELVTFLNKLLSPLSDAILRHEGAIDKYIGDSIMAFWNAPLDVEDHPRKAARAALEMMERLKDLNARDEFGFHRPELGLGDVQIGIGLNSGEGCVGNMGSVNRFDYSVVGDTVNVAARIESTTKPAGWYILLSETTAAGCPDFAIL
ncbi:MAG TPA: adenylate/guanylate cyclase domain-containing protein, partial [Rhizobiaceae bacterium]|nr:adenylate/guanylate cyclase domain-containing protein [Rhizobiaceae bacterium]